MGPGDGEEDAGVVVVEEHVRCNATPAGPKTAGETPQIAARGCASELLREGAVREAIGDEDVEHVVRDEVRTPWRLQRPRQRKAVENSIGEASPRAVSAPSTE